MPRNTPICPSWIILLAAFFALTGVIDGQAKNQEEPPRINMEPMVITGTFIPVDPEKGSASVSVMTGEQIERAHLSSVTEGLRHIQGLHIDQPGARGSVSSVYIRGGDPNHTVVMIDGVKVNDPTNSRGGSFDFSTLSVDSIERIEIVRGPVSSIYGSDAIVGAINIITRRGAEKPMVQVDLSGGLFGYHRGLLEARGSLDRLDFSTSVSYLDNGEPVKGTGFINTTWHANAGIRLTDRTAIRSVARYTVSRMEAYPDDSGGPEYAVIVETEERDAGEFILGMDLTHQPYPSLKVDIHTEYYHRDETIDSPGVAPGARDPFGIPPNKTDHELHRYRVTQSNLLAITDHLQLILGGEFQSEEGQSNGILLIEGVSIPIDFEMDRDLWAAFLEGRFAATEGLLLEAGLRWDDPEGFDPRTSPRVGFSYSIRTLDTRLRGNWGKGFKLPSFFALGHPIVGNPDLDLEKSQSWEFGFTQPIWGGHVIAHATYFSTIVKNAVDFEEGPPPILVNRDEIKTRGLEIGGTLRARPKLTVSPHLTYVKTKIEGTDEELRNRPEWRGGAILFWQPLQTLAFNLDLLFVGKVLDSSIPTGDRDLDAYTRVNLSATWTVNPKWKCYLILNNLFDAEYEEAVGFTNPGILLRGGVRVTM